MRLIGRCKTLCYLARVRVAATKLHKHVKRFVARFRKKRKIKYALQLRMAMNNFGAMEKMATAGRIVMLKVVQIQRAWRRYQTELRYIYLVNRMRFNEVNKARPLPDYIGDFYVR